MAPFDSALGHWGGNVVNVAIGFAFGFVLERAGFGDARKLAAQFYLRDQSVLKVMFTAIVVAMLLIFGAGALGLLDFEAVWVNPTYLWPGIIGGLLLGVGFIIGGYCPGTSVVAAATLKLDGLVFLLGCLSGIFVFGQTVGWYQSFWEQAGYLGRFTIPDWLGLANGTVVLLVVLMALGMFAGAEWLEAFLGGRSGDVSAAGPTGRRLRLGPRRRLSARRAAAFALVGCGVLVAVLPDAGTRRLRDDVERQIAGRTRHVDPVELLSLMHNNQVKLALFDVRGEADYNAFHLLDAVRVRPKAISEEWAARLAPDSINVILADDEPHGEAVLRELMLKRAPNVYLLAGGVKGWLNWYSQRAASSQPSLAAGAHGSRGTLGSRNPAAKPSLKLIADASVPHKVRMLGPVVKKSGGCGG